MCIAYFQSKYKSSKNSKGFARKVNSTHKWVEYTLDVKEMRKLLAETVDFNEKFTLNKCIDVAERKRDYHYRQDNFDLRNATVILSAVSFQ